MWRPAPTCSPAASCCSPTASRCASPPASSASTCSAARRSPRPATSYGPSLQSAIEALGYRFGHAEEYLVARPPGETEAETLRLDPGEWVVEVLRTSFATDGTPVHTLQTVCAASRHVFPIGQVAGADEF